MRLLYAKLSPPNFGDEINPYLWNRLFPSAFDSDDGVDFFGIGTILSQEAGHRDRTKVVFGTGAGYWAPPAIDDTWKIYFVRGPITAKLLGLSEKLAITDAAYCLSFVDDARAPGSGEVVFMPHHKSESEVDWAAICSEAGVRYVSTALDVRATLGILRSAKCVISEAMHGAIVADIFRVPWIPVRYGMRSLDLKWQDWCQSISLPYAPIDLPPLLDARLTAHETLERATKRI